MLNIKKFLPGLSLTVLVFSCSTKDTIQQDKQAVAAIKNQNNSKTSNKIQLPWYRLCNGQTITIEFQGLGCFYSQHERVTVKRINDNYLLNYTDIAYNNDVHIIEDSLVDSTFASTLKSFSNYCEKQLSNYPAPRPETNERKISNVHSLVISDGLHYYDIPMDEGDHLSPCKILMDHKKYFHQDSKTL